MEGFDVQEHKVVSRQEWLESRREHLAREKELTRLRDRVSQERRELPWVRVEQEYDFDGPNGKRTLSELFDGRSQLLVYHFMFGPDWEEGCKSCSFWADNYNGIFAHLNHRDVTLVGISKAPIDKLLEFKKRMDWSFPWFSSLENSFNRDYHVSFTPQELERGEVDYNYTKTRFPSEEAPGVSVFYKDDAGNVFHTYSCYSRGLDILNSAYHMLDLVPKGRDEADLPYGMAWVRHHDRYDDD